MSELNSLNLTDNTLFPDSSSPGITVSTSWKPVPKEISSVVELVSCGSLISVDCFRMWRKLFYRLQKISK